MAHAGPAARVHLLIAGYSPAHLYGKAAPQLDNATYLTVAGSGLYRMSEPPVGMAVF